ncbi:MAG: endonuclease, partial [Sorangium cellulosum]
GCYLIVGGDFNTKKRSKVTSSAMSDILVTSGPYPVDQDGNGDTNQNRDHPYDWLIANRALDKLEIPLEIGNSKYPNGLVFDSRVYTPLSEVDPIEPSDSGTSSMQHMPVVRAFSIPVIED